MFPACGCTVFPLPFTVTGHCPATNYSFVSDAVGVRKVKTTVLAWHLLHGAHYKDGACKVSGFVVGCKAVVQPAIPPQTPVNAVTTVGDTTMTLTRLHGKGDKSYFTYGIPGVRGRLYVTATMLQGAAPETIEVDGPVFAEATADDVSKNAAKEARAAEKLAKQEEKMRLANEKAAARIAKQEAALAKARERVAKAESKVAGASTQPNL